MTRRDIRSLVRGLFLFAAGIGLAHALGFALEWTAAIAVLTVAIIMARGSLRVLHPPIVPRSRSAFPDPVGGTEDAPAVATTGSATYG